MPMNDRETSNTGDAGMDDAHFQFRAEQKVQDSELSGRLREWSARRAASAEQLEKLKHEILRQVPQQRRGADRTARLVPAAAPQKSGATGLPDRRTRLILFAIGAALILLAVSLGHAPDQRLPSGDRLAMDAGPGGERIERLEALPDYAAIPVERRREQTLLLHEMRALFGSRLTWFADLPEQLELGIQNQERPENTPALAVRLVVEQRLAARSEPSAGEHTPAEWTPVCIVDVVMQSDEYVAFQPSCLTSGVVAIWSHILPDGEVAIDTDVRLSTAQSAPLTASQVVTDDRPRLLSHKTIDDTEIRVLQAVSVLDDRMG